MSLSEPSMPDTTPSYGITPQGYARAVRLQVIITLVGWGLMLLVLIGLFIYLMRSSEMAEQGLVYALIFVVPLTLFATAAAAGAGIFRYFMLKRSLDKYRVSLGEDSITISGQGINAITVRRDEITDLSESKRYGLMIWTQKRYQIPFVNPYVEHYDEIRERLISWHPLTNKPLRLGWLRLRLPLTLICIFVIMLVPSYFAIGAGWLILTGVNAYLIYFSANVPDLTPTTRTTAIGGQVFIIVIGSLAALSATMRLALASRAIP